jgi:hypothetical protein
VLRTVIRKPNKQNQFQRDGNTNQFSMKFAIDLISLILGPVRVLPYSFKKKLPKKMRLPEKNLPKKNTFQGNEPLQRNAWRSSVMYCSESHRKCTSAVSGNQVYKVN